MKQINYNGNVPGLQTFKNDSGITFANRNEDQILTKLDKGLEKYNLANAKSDYSLRRIALVDLFLTANYWIKSYHQQNKLMKAERYPAVSALFEAVVAQLATLLQCPRPQVSRRIEEIFGRDLTSEGVSTDIRFDAKIYDKVERGRHRLHFRGGLAYRYEAVANGPMQLVPLDSSKYYTKLERGRQGDKALQFENWGPFVMTLEREFYMSKHTLNVPDAPNIFHSAYTGGYEQPGPAPYQGYTQGATVSAAGTMYVVAGKILGIRPDSGHYKPIENNIIAAIMALEMFNVPVAAIKVYDWAGNELGSAEDFKNSRLTWAEFEKAREDLRQKRRDYPTDMRPAAQHPPPLPPRN